jgi:ABC-type spermidine/putrescine transport system permease subunit II
MTVFYLSAVLISLLSAAAIALAGTISLSVDLLRQSDQIQNYINIPLAYPLIGLVLGLYHLFFQMSMYTALLKEPNPSKGKNSA